MLHFFCLSRKAANRLLLNVVRLCLNLTEHMLGGIKAILFLKQCSTQLSLAIILSRILLQNESLVAVPKLLCVLRRLRDQCPNWQLQPINVPVPDLDCTYSLKANLVTGWRGFGGHVLYSWWDGGVKMPISQSFKSQTQLSYLELLGRVACFNGGGSLSGL